MPKKSAKQPPKQESQLLAILPPKPDQIPDSVPEPTPEPTPALTAKPEPTAKLSPKPKPEPQPESQPKHTTESAETTTDEPAQASKKVVSVVPRKVQEAEALGIPLEAPPEEIVIPEGVVFQGVGVITGAVTFTEAEEGRATATVTFAGKTYPLLYVPGKGFSFGALRKQVANHGAMQRLIVYPKFTHYPSRDVDYSVAFQLVAFDTGGDPEGISGQLQDGEFQLCGLWQFIPVCRTPCISVFKSFSRERLRFIKEAAITRKVGFMKASHLPLFWRDAPVSPFRFNPKAPKEEQGRPVFVQVKAKFVPHRNAFEFDSLLGVPLPKAPNFLKASKVDKAAAMAEKKQRKAEREQAERELERQAKRAASGAATRPQPKPKPKPQ